MPPDRRAQPGEAVRLLTRCGLFRLAAEIAADPTSTTAERINRAVGDWRRCSDYDLLRILSEHGFALRTAAPAEPATEANPEPDAIEE